MTGTHFLVAVIIVLMILVVVSLVRGIAAFLKGSKAQIDGTPDGGATESQLKQNKMMFARIKFQFLAVIVLAIVMAVGKHH